MKQPAFVSYSGGDRDFVVKLVRDLSALGVSTWWDHTDLKVGQHIAREIEVAISKASFFLIVLTPQAMKSRWVNQELDIARTRASELDRPFILPIRLEPGNYPLDLSGTKYADFHKSYESGFQTLVDVLAPPLMPELLADLTSGDADLVAMAARRIPEDRRAVYVAKLREFWYSDDAELGPVLRLSALVAFHTIQVPNLSPLTLAAAKDESAAVRRQSAVYLSRMSNPAARAALIELREDRAQTVRDVAKEALRRLGL